MLCEANGPRDGVFEALRRSSDPIVVVGSSSLLTTTLDVFREDDVTPRRVRLLVDEDVIDDAGTLVRGRMEDHQQGLRDPMLTVRASESVSTDCTVAGEQVFATLDTIAQPVATLIDDDPSMGVDRFTPAWRDADPSGQPVAPTVEWRSAVGTAAGDRATTEWDRVVGHLHRCPDLDPVRVAVWSVAGAEGLVRDLVGALEAADLSSQSTVSRRVADLSEAGLVQSVVESDDSTSGRPPERLRRRVDVPSDPVPARVLSVLSGSIQ